ncbi:protein of unknown function [Candidatus Nitrospira inopinata]|uniref:Uncharacterized protein n=1 Tax=Candidatus Nitrospira inopinata TaxID=1715989 RepID=A0A0S4KTZ9_9BACT|nr:protein of unknown function [Candidatus Nitrospira inopinata]
MLLPATEQSRGLTDFGATLERLPILSGGSSVAGYRRRKHWGTLRQDKRSTCSEKGQENMSDPFALTSRDLRGWTLGALNR